MSKNKRQTYDKTNLIAAIRAVIRGKRLSATARLYSITKTNFLITQKEDSKEAQEVQGKHLH